MIRFFLCLLLVGCQINKEDKERRIYLLHAKEAHFSRDPIDEHVGNLTMRDIGDTLLYLSQTETGHLPLVTFLQRWQQLRKALKDTPPNRGYLLFEGYQLPIEFVLPNLDAKTLSIVLKSRDAFPIKDQEIKSVTLFFEIEL